MKNSTLVKSTHIDTSQHNKYIAFIYNVLELQNKVFNNLLEKNCGLNNIKVSKVLSKCTKNTN